MLSINHRFSKHCRCHLQGEYVVGRILEALGGELGLMVLISGAEEWIAVQ
jgi:hypothetical protein